MKRKALGRSPLEPDVGLLFSDGWKAITIQHWDKFSSPLLSRARHLVYRQGPVFTHPRPVGGTHVRTPCECCGGAMQSYTTKVMPFNLPRGNQPRGMVLCFTCFAEELYS